MPSSLPAQPSLAPFHFVTLCTSISRTTLQLADPKSQQDERNLSNTIKRNTIDSLTGMFASHQNSPRTVSFGAWAYVPLYKYNSWKKRVCRLASCCCSLVCVASCWEKKTRSASEVRRRHTVREEEEAAAFFALSSGQKACGDTKKSEVRFVGERKGCDG